MSCALHGALATFSNLHFGPKLVLPVENSATCWVCTISVSCSVDNLMNSSMRNYCRSKTGKNSRGFWACAGVCPDLFSQPVLLWWCVLESPSSKSYCRSSDKYPSWRVTPGTFNGTYALGNALLLRRTLLGNAVRTGWRTNSFLILLKCGMMETSCTSWRSVFWGSGRTWENVSLWCLLQVIWSLIQSGG